jgi:hypothetical protein
MKKLFFISALCFLFSAAAQADFRIYRTLQLTNAANLTNGSAFTLGSDTRTGTNGVLASTLFYQLTNRVDKMRTNLYNAIAANPFSGITTIIDLTGTNSLTFIGGTNVNFSLSVYGSWANISNYTSTVFSSAALITPYTIQSNVFREWQMSQLADMLNWATNQFSNTITVLSRFLSTRTNGQHGTNIYFELGNWGGALSNAQLSGALFTNGTLYLTSAPTVKTIVALTTNTTFINSNAGGQGFFFPDQNTSKDPDTGYANNIIAAVGDIYDTYPGFNEEQLSFDFFADAIVTILGNAKLTNSQFFGPTNTVRGNLQFAVGSALQSADTLENWNYKSLAEVKDSSTALRPNDFPASQYSFNGTNLTIKSGANLTNVVFWGPITVNGVFNGGLYSNITFNAGSGIVGNLIATNANIYVLLSTNFTLSNGSMTLGNLYATALRGPTTNFGAMAFVPAYVTTMSAGANSITRLTNNLIFFSGSASASFDSITTNLGGGDFFFGWNRSGGSIAIKHESTATAEGLVNPGTRINTPDGTTVNWPNNTLALFWHEAGSVNRWLPTVFANTNALATNVVLQSVGNTNATRIGLESTNTSGGVLQLKTLSAGNSITLTNEGTNVVVAFSGTTGEANVNGEVSVTNAARFGLVNGKSGVTNLTRSISPGYGLSGTNEGTNIVLAINPAVVASQSDLTTLSNNLADVANWPGYSGQFGQTQSVYALGWNQITATPWGTSGTVLTNGNYRLFPWFSGSGGVITQMSCNVKTAPSGNIRFGIYESTSTKNFWPSNLVYDSGSAVSAVAIMTSNCTVTIKPARMYWSVVQADAASAVAAPTAFAAHQVALGFPSLAAMSVSGGAPLAFEYQPGTYGTLPSTFPAGSTPANVIWQTASGYTVILAARFQ